MVGCRVDGRNSAWVKSGEEMFGRFQGELISSLPEWKERLKRCPDQLASLEREVHVAYARGADLLIVGLVSMVMKEKAFDAACQQTRRGFLYPLERGRMREVRVRLLGGLLMWVSSLYCAPRSTGGGKERKVPGLREIKGVKCRPVTNRITECGRRASKWWRNRRISIGLSFACPYRNTMNKRQVRLGCCRGLARYRPTLYHCLCTARW